LFGVGVGAGYPFIANDLAGKLPGNAVRAVGCRATDGDTIRCGDERIRLLGIDAPELAGHCRRGRVCAPGDGQASKRSLERLIADPVRVTRYGRDRYGRTLAVVYAGKVNTSCRQLEQKQAIYRRDWDNGRHVGAACPAAAMERTVRNRTPNVANVSTSPSRIVPKVAAIAGKLGNGSVSYEGSVALSWKGRLETDLAAIDLGGLLIRMVAWSGVVGMAVLALWF
jgi:hypothetical protein